MSLNLFTLLKLVLLVLTCLQFCSSTNRISSTDLSREVSCPLNFNVLRGLVNRAPLRKELSDLQSQCKYVSEGIRLLRSEYLRREGYFSPPPAISQACWESYRSLISEFLNGFDIQSACGYHSELIWNGCMSNTSRREFESQFPESELQEIRLYCSHSLHNGFACKSCIDKLLNIGKLHLHGSENNSECSSDMFIYAAAFINSPGLTDPGSLKCFFRFDFSMQITARKHHKPVIFGVLLGCIIGISGASIAVCLFWVLHKEHKKEPENNNVIGEDASLDLGFGWQTRSTNLVKFKIQEIREATINFSRHNLIGSGGFGNVYKGKLPDGSEVAFKRFKNCSSSSDATFAHEVEITASVRHVNLVALKGYCTATVRLEGHQRIVVCDLMHNGSLYDHLFGSGTTKLSWPIRQKIALGTARGLAYLHYGVHPAIIHRDIKASNILLDETFEAKVADFGLAKFNSQGMTHLSTTVAGSLGYVAPEYAMYGKLTERSDVYSFGVVLLELLSGKKAYQEIDGKVSLLTDWAWSLVKEGRSMDVIEDNMPEIGSTKMMELYVHIAVICAHPILQARPTMDQIVKTLETNSNIIDEIDSRNRLDTPGGFI